MTNYVKRSGDSMIGALHIGEGPNPVWETPLSTWASPSNGALGYTDAATFQGEQSADGSDYGSVEVLVQNLAPTGTGDFIASPDDEILDARYIDMGIDGSAYDGNAMGWGFTIPYDGYIYVQSSGSGGNFSVGVTGATKKLQLFAGGSEGSNVKIVVSTNGVQFGCYDANTTGGPFTYTTNILDMASTPKITIDPSNRKLYSPNGTSVALDWSVAGMIKPPQSASAPSYVKGGVYFDTTLNKLCVGGATGWETITSVPQ